MNIYTKQLNKVLAILILTMIVSSIGTSSANAAFSNWFSGNDNQASSSQTFGAISYFLSPNDQLAKNDNQSDQKDLSLVQNNSLAPVSSPVNTKSKVATQKNTDAKIGSEIIVMATAYSSTPDQTDSSPFITAMGTHVRDGIIAANFLPFGTRIKIPEIYGNRVFVVEDRMNRRYWHVIDLWFPDRNSALEFGSKKVKIQILES